MSYIYAKKGNQTTRFTAFVWKNMGPNKNGWVQTTEGGQTATKSTTAASNDVESEKLYRRLNDNAKGFIKDGKLPEALAKLKEAAEIKTTKQLTNKIEELEKQIAEASESGDENQELFDTIAEADKAFDAGEFGRALELYGNASLMGDSDHVDARIKETETKLLNPE